MAASAAGEVPRGGMEFLLSRNRINVAVSRGQWRAVVVRSPELTNYLPTHPEGLENLGGFVASASGQSPRRVPDHPSPPPPNWVALQAVMSLKTAEVLPSCTARGRARASSSTLPKLVASWAKRPRKSPDTPPFSCGRSPPGLAEPPP